MHPLKSFCIVIMCFVAPLSLTACGGGSDDAPELGQVSGIVTLDGAPLADANITFMPEGVRSSSATTDSTGKYELIYIRDEKGAAIGKHAVVISKLKNEVETIPAKYSGESELTADVKEGTNEFNFDLTSK